MKEKENRMLKQIIWRKGCRGHVDMVLKVPQQVKAVISLGSVRIIVRNSERGRRTTFFYIVISGVGKVRGLPHV